MYQRRLGSLAWGVQKWPTIWPSRDQSLVDLDNMFVLSNEIYSVAMLYIVYM